jgi:hypothetical protein
MGEKARGAAAPLIDRTPPRVIFAELVAGALDRTSVETTPLAATYLVDLLEDRVRLTPVPERPAGGEETLAEALLVARQLRGAARLRRLRSLGDRALFVSGFLGDSLDRRAVGIRYYADAGRLAYADLSSALFGRSTQRTWSNLFEELADRFPDLVEVLAEVGDSSQARQPGALLRLYGRYLRSGAERERRRLLRRGQLVPERGTLRFDQ